MPLVSIVVPVYNVSIYLKELLTGLTNQTFKDIEIICVDDGSIDLSAEIIKDFCQKDERVKYIYQSNQGGGVARNTGIANAQGKYVICLDADDIYEPNMIELLYEKAEKTNAEIVICDFAQIDMISEMKSHGKGLNKNILKNLDLEKTFSKKDVKGILRLTNPGPCNKLYRMDFIQNNNLYYSATKTINDLRFSKVAIAIAERVAIVDKELATYRYLSLASGSRNRSKTAHHSIVAFHEIYDFLTSNNIFEELKEDYISIVIDSILYESGFDVGDEYINAVKNLLNEYPFSELSKDDFEKLFKVKKKQRQLVEYTVLSFLVLGLHKSLNIKRNSTKCLLVNLKKYKL